MCLRMPAIWKGKWNGRCGRSWVLMPQHPIQNRQSKLNKSNCYSHVPPKSLCYVAAGQRLCLSTGMLRVPILRPSRGIVPKTAEVLQSYKTFRPGYCQTDPVTVRQRGLRYRYPNL